MIVDGKRIAEEVYARVRARIEALDKKPVLAIFTCAPTFETKKYLALKTKKAEAVGITIRLEELSEVSTTEEIVAAIERVLPDVDGAILQLPFPAHIDQEKALAAIPHAYDVDALAPGNEVVLSPVVAACKEILKREELTVFDKNVVVIGSGKLVGLPAAKWCMAEGAHVSVVTKDTVDVPYYTKQADIIISGAGAPGLITEDMVKEGVVLLDAGTSEDGGMLRGDADPRCAEKAVLFTPVPGGIGPITVAMLFQNLLDLMEMRKQ